MWIGVTVETGPDSGVLHILVACLCRLGGRPHTPHAVVHAAAVTTPPLQVEVCEHTLVVQDCTGL